MAGASVLVVETNPVSVTGRLRSDGPIIGRSAAMREILDRVRKIAGTSAPVLLQGEIGVGKTMIARAIHRQSRRAAGPFVRVACGSLRESELEEKLFGEPGDCFRADRAGPAGLFESSQHGTLYLDGVAQLPLWAQAKLLDALHQGSGQSREDDAIIPTQVRVIASGTSDLETAVARNHFCSRLYYYLSVVRIDVPPLRHRQEDIRALAGHFLAEAVVTLCPPGHGLPRRFSEEAWECLLECDWPGNVLQLAAVVARAVMLAEGPEISQACVAALLGRVRQHPDGETISVPLAGGLKEMELAIINEVIRRCRGNKAAAARTLGLHRRTLYRLLEE